MCGATMAPRDTVMAPVGLVEASGELLGGSFGGVWQALGVIMGQPMALYVRSRPPLVVTIRT